MPILGKLQNLVSLTLKCLEPRLLSGFGFNCRLETVQILNLQIVFPINDVNMFPKLFPNIRQLYLDKCKIVCTYNQNHMFGIGKYHRGDNCSKCMSHLAYILKSIKSLPKVRHQADDLNDDWYFQLATPSRNRRRRY